MFPEKISERLLWTLAILFVIGVAVITPTVYMSFHTVTYDQMAIVRDVYGKADTSTVYTQGRYFLPLTKQFVYFDGTYEPIVFTQANGNPLQVALSNGVQISLDVMFEYRVLAPQLASLYNQYSTSYISQMSTVAEAAIKSTVIQFQETDYVHNRLFITQLIGQAVQSKLAQEIFVYAPADKFQLMSVYFPGSVVQKNLEAAIEIQNNEVAQLQQVVVDIQQETARQVAQVNADTTQILALATIQASQQVQQAQNTLNNIAVEARALALEAFFNTLNVNDTQVVRQLITYLDVLDTKGNIKLLSLSNFGNNNNTVNTMIQV